MNPKEKPVLLVALGGNALQRSDRDESIQEQLDNLRLPMGQIVSLSEDYRIIITHGNGPQVGNLLLQQECCGKLPRLPLEVLVAQTEGQLGYMIESTLDSEFMARDINDKLLVSLVTYVVVDKDDPAFQNPDKPIGPSYEEKDTVGLPFPVAKTASKGWRRVVASPKPVTVIEKREIRKLIEMDFIVICCGGGGIPVIRKDRGFHGMDSVIDKDLASAVLAREVGVDIMVIATDIDRAYVNFKTPEQEALERITPDQAEEFIRQGHFKAGSMEPKMTACAQFVRGGGRKAVISSLQSIEDAVRRDDVGTVVMK